MPCSATAIAQRMQFISSSDLITRACSDAKTPSIINPEILKGHLSHPYPFDIWTIILKPLISQSKVTAHFDDSLWMDVGTFDRLKLARKRLKDEN